MGTRKQKPQKVKSKPAKRSWNEMQEDKELSLNILDNARAIARKSGVSWIRVNYPADNQGAWRAIIYKNRFEAVKGFFKEMLGWG